MVSGCRFAAALLLLPSLSLSLPRGRGGGRWGVGRRSSGGAVPPYRCQQSPRPLVYTAGRGPAGWVDNYRPPAVTETRRSSVLSLPPHTLTATHDVDPPLSSRELQKRSTCMPAAGYQRGRAERGARCEGRHPLCPAHFLCASAHRHPRTPRSLLQSSRLLGLPLDGRWHSYSVLGYVPVRAGHERCCCRLRRQGLPGAFSAPHLYNCGADSAHPQPATLAPPLDISARVPPMPTCVRGNLRKRAGADPRLLV